jgi:DNA-directed RNA polymerase III subunit RPC5
LHPIQETHQFRPTLTYLDHLSRKERRSRRTGDGSDSDDGPPLDPDEPVAPAPASPPKKEKKAVEIKELQATSRKVEDKNGLQTLGGLSAARREMLLKMRAEEDETWQDLEYFDVEVFVVHCIVIFITDGLLLERRGACDV